MCALLEEGEGVKMAIKANCLILMGEGIYLDIKSDRNLHCTNKT